MRIQQFIAFSDVKVAQNSCYMVSMAPIMSAIAANHKLIMCWPSQLAMDLMNSIIYHRFP